MTQRDIEIMKVTHLFYTGQIDSSSYAIAIDWIVNNL